MKDQCVVLGGRICVVLSACVVLHEKQIVQFCSDRSAVSVGWRTIAASEILLSL